MATVWYVLAAGAMGCAGMFLTATGLGGLPFVILAVLFAGLKVVGNIEWSWWWALLPLWGAIGGAIAKMWMITRDPMWRQRL